MLLLTILSSVCALIFFALQLYLCIKGLSRSVRIMPVMLILIGVFLTVMHYTGAFSRPSPQYIPINAHELEALIYGFMLIFASAGDLIAWIVYYFMKKKGKV